MTGLVDHSNKSPARRMLVAALSTAALVLAAAVMPVLDASLVPAQARAHSGDQHDDARLPFPDIAGSELTFDQLLGAVEVGTAETAGRSADSGAGATAFCGPDDAPEPGLQGQTPLADMLSRRSQDPYFCGVRLIGHTDIGNRGANLQLARSGRCAYVSSMKTLFPQDPEDPVTTRPPAGVAVIDVSNPRKPESVGLLRDPGSLDSVETMDAIDAGKRHVLVAGDYSGGTGSGGEETGPAALSIYDVSQCTEPKLMATFHWPHNAHDVTLSPDGKRVYGTRPTDSAGFMVADITDMRRPRLIADVPLILPDGTATSCHTVELNKAETRLYCAGLAVSSRAERDEEYPSLFPGGPSIWDISEISKGTRNPKVRFVGESQIAGQGWHHAVPARINGKPYVIAASELARGEAGRHDCEAAAFPRIWDISDERKPRLVGEFRLEVQDHCGDPNVAMENELGNYASHYNSVDSTFGEKTRLGLFSFVGAGIRIVDLRDPRRPREVAYYKPGANPITTLQPVGARTSRRPTTTRTSPTPVCHGTLTSIGPARSGSPARPTAFSWSSSRPRFAST